MTKRESEKTHFGAWLDAAMSGVSYRAIGRDLYNDGDERGRAGAARLRQYRDGKHAPGPKVAFKLGEALRVCAEPWASGPVALIALGHHAAFVALLRALGMTHPRLAIALLHDAPFAACVPFALPETGVTAPAKDVTRTHVETLNAAIRDARERLALLLSDAPLERAERRFYPKDRIGAIAAAWENHAKPVRGATERQREAAAAADYAALVCDGWRNVEPLTPEETFVAATLWLKAWALKIAPSGDQNALEAWARTWDHLNRYKRAIEPLSPVPTGPLVVAEAPSYGRHSADPPNTI